MQASNVTELRGREEAKNITARQGKKKQGRREDKTSFVEPPETGRIDYAIGHGKGKRGAGAAGLCEWSSRAQVEESKGLAAQAVPRRNAATAARRTLSSTMRARRSELPDSGVSRPLGTRETKKEITQDRENVDSR